MIGNTNSDANKITLRNGGRNDPADGTWGTVTPANGYTQEVVINHNIGGSDGGFIMATKNGQTSVQIDGYFYQNEGSQMVATAGNTANVEQYRVDGAFNYNTWYRVDVNNGAIVVIKSRNRQNLVVYKSWNSDLSQGYYTIWEHWDNNNGDGIATATVPIEKNAYFYVSTNSNRDYDGTDRLAFFQFKQV